MIAFISLAMIERLAEQAMRDFRWFSATGQRARMIAYSRGWGFVWFDDLLKQADYLTSAGQYPYLCTSQEWTLYA